PDCRKSLAIYRLKTVRIQNAILNIKNLQEISWKERLKMKRPDTYNQKLKAILKAIKGRGIKTAEKILRQEIEKSGEKSRK
ncbi:unnamed protein product, partial [marine sediment metagenome]